MLNIPKQTSVCIGRKFNLSKIFYGNVRLRDGK